MIVTFLGNIFPQKLLSVGYTAKSKINLTQGKEYEVFSIAGWAEDDYYCVILDVDIPCWLPSTVFETVNNQIPQDWIRLEIGGEMKFLFGPEELVKDEADYIALVSLDPEAVGRFWSYVENLHAS